MKPEIYEGNEKYIFISYAHRDSDVVLNIAKAITEAGYRIWYDDGIAAGSEWPETIAQHLDRAAAFLVFISPNSVISDNCRNEINFAIARKKPFLSVFLEDTDVPLGIELQIASKQGVIRSKCRSQDEFISKIIDSDIIAECKRPEGMIENADLQAAGDGPEDAGSNGEAAITSQSRADLGRNAGANYKKVVAVCVAAVLLIVAVLLMNNLKSDDSVASEDLNKSANKASESVTDSADSAEADADTNSSEADDASGAGNEGEGVTSGDYIYDYPSFSGKELLVTDARELENALRDAGAGDTIKIQSGEYETDRTLFIDKQIRLCGEGDSKPVIHSSLRVRTGGALIDNIEISINDTSQTYDSEYREDRYSCIETDGSDTPTYIRDSVLKVNANIGCAGITAYGPIVMENSYIDTDGEAIFLTSTAELNGNTFNSGYRGILVWGLYGIKDNPPEKLEEFRNNNTFQAPTDIESREE